MTQEPDNQATLLSYPRLWTAAGLLGLAALALVTIPDLAAQVAKDDEAVLTSMPVGAEHAALTQRRLLIDGVRVVASRQIDAASVQANEAASRRFNRSAMDWALQASLDDDLPRARSYLREHIKFLKDSPSSEAADEDHRAAIDQARLFLGHVSLRLGEPGEAAAVLGEISDRTPVNDAVSMLLGRALMASGNPQEAASSFNQSFNEDSTILKWHARAEQAHALAAAEQFEPALEALDDLADNFPDYPRRHRVLLERSQSLEALGRLDEAALAYQTAWYEFPHKPEGRRALAAADRLADAGHRAEPLSRDALFRRYRRLRINKHWPLAERLFLELKQQESTPGGHSEFEHEILMQLALNDFVPQRYEEALAWLEELRAAFESGHREGIDEQLLYKYLSRTYSRLGRLDEAYQALLRQLEGRGSYTRNSETAEFFEDHGQYQRAREIYDSYYSAARKRGWHYTWLLYKTGDWTQAHDNLMRLAERSRGRRQAKYMYWAARALDRSGATLRAVALFEEVARRHQRSYYGLQARNRLIDIRQRSTVDRALVSESFGVLDGSDEALRVLDEAAAAAPTSPTSPTSDPRAVPRLVDETPAIAISPQSCDAETAADETYCQLRRGQLPRRAQDALGAVLSPGYAYGANYSGLAPALDSMHAARNHDPEASPTLLDPSAQPVGPLALPESSRPSERAQSANTPARIFWSGRTASELSARADYKPPGPLPAQPTAYDHDAYHGGLARAVEQAGGLFPALRRVQWLRRAGLVKWARWEMRGVTLEYRGLSTRGRALNAPHELDHPRWGYLIDNRRRETGLWGLQSPELRFPVPKSSSAERALLRRQQQIYDRRESLAPLILDAAKEVGDYHLVRRFTLGSGPWYRRSPTGPQRTKWMQAYPRAFPRQIIREATKNGLNPYLMWAIMTVESSFNPDSISPADAIGLMQVIPRTGIKVAEMIGDEDFGPFDLINEDVAIRHGAHYYARLVEKFHGQELLAIAGYNGGPHRVAAWLDKRGRGMPMDEFVEEIPFNEARGYTKKVIRFLALYLRIYEGVDQLYIGQDLRTDYLAQPNF